MRQTCDLLVLLALQLFSSINFTICVLKDAIWEATSTCRVQCYWSWLPRGQARELKTGDNMYFLSNAIPAEHYFTRMSNSVDKYSIRWITLQWNDVVNSYLVNCTRLLKVSRLFQRISMDLIWSVAYLS